MKKHLIIIGLLGSLLACTGQPSGGDANIRSAQKYPYRFHTYTPHIYVDAFLNDSLQIVINYQNFMRFREDKCSSSDIL